MKHQLSYSLQRPIYIFNQVVNTKLPATLSHQCSTTVSLETYAFYFKNKTCFDKSFPELKDKSKTSLAWKDVAKEVGLKDIMFYERMYTYTAKTLM